MSFYTLIVSNSVATYAPHTIAIVLLVLIVIIRAPTIYALMILYQHEEKPLLLTCIVVDVVYLFTWILLWLMLTLKREWSFDIAHAVHQIYALQKGIASGHIKGNENPSQLKNSVIVMQRDHMFVTDDQAVKQSLLRHLQRGHFEAPEEMYWSKSNGNHNSPNTRLLRHVHDVTPAQSIGRGNSSPDGRAQSTFGTLQRNQNGAYAPTLQRNPPSVQRSLATTQWPTQQEAYASIHKSKEHQLYQRRDSTETPQYGKVENNYSSYGTYARMPLQSRIPIPPGQKQNTTTISSNNYSQKYTV
ncbi:hypothetical protein KIN20_018586 [Parelaphostrongylus tenuis]|uniref:Uncharacterized protein n=1 Tax=Parelaphostrongylus tenuis TaxID=148309 RepID=A0AAD5MN82_PARTN|nr:hypothetical protein KIN20_018586 [Parelaphostrongylus tenuis]